MEFHGERGMMYEANHLAVVSKIEVDGCMKLVQPDGALDVGLYRCVARL